MREWLNVNEKEASEFDVFRDRIEPVPQFRCVSIGDHRLAGAWFVQVAEVPVKSTEVEAGLADRCLLQKNRVRIGNLLIHRRN